ncbi:MAG: aminotransferase class IV [Chloroflexi bacterium]|nr:aminotransferase class IV [Chloroflexota bacterium]
MAEPTPLIYLNGRMLSESNAHLSPLDRGFTLADGLFETMVALGERVFRLRDHLSRLREGAEVLHLELPPEEELAEAVREVLRRNGREKSVVRLTVTRGVDPGRGLDVSPGIAPTVVVRATAWSGPATTPSQGLRAVVSTVRRNDLSPLSRIKSLSYVEAVVARLQARRSGAEDALLCNTRGHLTGATSSNIFAIIGNALVTPPQEDGVLPGVARRTVLEEAKALTFPAGERSVTPEEIAGADEVFLTNVVTGVVPVVSLDGRPIGRGVIGPETERLRQMYWERVRRELR